MKETVKEADEFIPPPIFDETDEDEDVFETSQDGKSTSIEPSEPDTPIEKQTDKDVVIWSSIMPPPPDDLPDAATIAELMTEKDTTQLEEPKPVLDPSYENMKIIGVIFPILVTTGLIVLVCIYQNSLVITTLIK